MKATRSIASALTLGTMMLASAAAAQTTTGGSGVQFGVGAGVSVPTGDLGDGSKTGFLVDGMLGFNPAAIPFGLRLDVGYSQNAFKDNAFDVDGNVKIFGGSVNGIFKLPATSISPYVIAGVGVANVKPDVSDIESESSTGFSLGGGAGLQFNLSGMASILEAKYSNVFTDENKIGIKNANFFTLKFGVLFGGGMTSGSRARTR
jgi:opacity protein-like surface antigen